MRFRWPQRTDPYSKDKSATAASSRQLNPDTKILFELKIDSLQVRASELAFVIGRIGSGKTALLHAIMNEMDNIFTAKQQWESNATAQPQI